MGWERCAYLQLRLDQIAVLLGDKKQETGFRAAQGHSQQISLINPGPPIMIEDHSRRLFGIVYPGGKGLGFPNFDRRWDGQERWGGGRGGFVDGLSGVGPLPAVSRALRLSSTGSRHPVNLIHLSDLTAQARVI